MGVDVAEENLSKPAWQRIVAGDAKEGDGTSEVTTATSSDGSADMGKLRPRKKMR